MFVVTIDGLAGCGKSSIAKGLASELNLKMLNTGAIYRGVTCEYLSKYGEKPPTRDVIAEFIKNLQVQVKFVNDVQHVIVNKVDYTKKLREEVVSNMTPSVSSFDILRDKVRHIQRDFAKKNNCVVEGRDIGRVVLKDADCKLFFVASSRVRAERRYNQMKASQNCPPFDEILKDIELRDEVDRTREHGAMIPAEDAIIVDNSDETMEQTLERCKKIVLDKISKREK